MILGLVISQVKKRDMIGGGTGTCRESLGQYPEKYKSLLVKYLLGDEQIEKVILLF